MSFSIDSDRPRPGCPSGRCVKQMGSNSNSKQNLGENFPERERWRLPGGNSHLQRQAFLSLRTAARLWYCGRCLPLLRPLRTPNGGHRRTEQDYSSKLTENTITCGEAGYSNGAISKCNHQAESKLSCPWWRRPQWEVEPREDCHRAGLELRRSWKTWAVRWRDCEVTRAVRWRGCEAMRLWGDAGSKATQAVRRRRLWGNLGREATWAVRRFRLWGDGLWGDLGCEAMQAVRQLELGSDTDREVAGALRRSGLRGFSGCEATKALRWHWQWGDAGCEVTPALRQRQWYGDADCEATPAASVCEVTQTAAPCWL